jgi:hypothetical protein
MKKREKSTSSINLGIRSISKDRIRKKLSSLPQINNQPQNTVIHVTCTNGLVCDVVFYNWTASGWVVTTKYDVQDVGFDIGWYSFAGAGF